MATNADPNRTSSQQPPRLPAAGFIAAAVLALGLSGCTQPPDAKAPNKDLGTQPLQTQPKQPETPPPPPPEPKPEPKPEPPEPMPPPPT